MGKKFKIESIEDVLNNATFRVKSEDFKEDEDDPIEYYLTSGNTVLDLALTNGLGYPAGVVMEFFGDEHTGKTTDWIVFAKQVQAAGGNVILWDAEGGFKKELGKLHGLIMKKPRFTRYRPKSLEAFCDMWEECCEAAAKLDVPTLLVVDSVAGLCPKRLGKKAVAMSKDERRVGEEARQFSWFFRRGFIHDIAGSKVFTIFVNQTRSEIGGAKKSKFAGPSFTTASGKTLKFYAGIRLEFSEASTRRNKHGNEVGAVKTIYTAKNKIIGKSRSCEVPIFYNTSWNDNKGIIYYLLSNKLFKADGTSGRYSLEGIDKKKFCAPLIKGETSWLAAMEKDGRFRRGMQRLVKAHYMEQWAEDDTWITK